MVGALVYLTFSRVFVIDSTFCIRLCIMLSRWLSCAASIMIYNLISFLHTRLQCVLMVQFDCAGIAMWFLLQLHLCCKDSVDDWCVLLCSVVHMVKWFFSVIHGSFLPFFLPHHQSDLLLLNCLFSRSYSNQSCLEFSNACIVYFLADRHSINAALLTASGSMQRFWPIVSIQF